MAGALIRLRWWAQHIVERGGLPALAAFALALACGVAWAAWVQPLAERVAFLQRANAAVEQQRSSQASLRPGPSEPLQEGQRLAQFVAGFPAEKDIAPTFATLNRIATRHGLQLAQAEFRLSAQGNEPLARYSMVLPVKAEYAQLRAFVDQLLRDMPSVALEELSLRRDDVQSELIDARLRLVMFLSRAG